MTRIALCFVAVALAAPALAQDKPANAPPAGAGAPDMTKVGPMSRKVTKQDKQGIDQLYKSFMDAFMKGDVNAAADLVDFPVLMLTDDKMGVAKHTTMTRDQWIEMMKPFANMPHENKMSHKHTPHFLSDTLAAVIEENGVTMGKTKSKWTSLGVVTLKDGKWKFKEMAEAGWGDMPMPGQGKPTSPTPTTTTPPAPRK